MRADIVGGIMQNPSHVGAIYIVVVVLMSQNFGSVCHGDRALMDYLLGKLNLCWLSFDSNLIDGT